MVSSFSALRARFEDRKSVSKDPAPPSAPPNAPPNAPTMRKPGGKMKTLSEQDVQFFMANGYIKIQACFTKADAEGLMGPRFWQRLRVSPDDKSTWNRERIDLPGSKTFSMQSFAPKAWKGICDLLGGEKRIAKGSDYWDDGFIVNLGSPQTAGKYIEPNGWHVDGNFFAHYLDSSEQALLVLPLFTDVRPGGGGTMLCPAALSLIANFLRDHPEGVSPDLIPRAEDPYWNSRPNKWRVGEFAGQVGPASYVEATGNVGDVYLLHPFMVHSWSNNMNRDLRVIKNPTVRLKEPFKFDRSKDADYSVVELTTLNLLQTQRLTGWKATGTRDMISSEQRRWERE